MRIYLVRHGETDWNQARRVQGGVDIPLNAYGIHLAEETAEGLKRVDFDVAYTSPLVRARKTAEIILNGRNIPLIDAGELREMNFGSYEGMCISGEHKAPESAAFHKFFTDTKQFVPAKDGESVQDVLARTGQFLRELIQNPGLQDKTVLLSTHGAAMTALLNHVKGNLELEHFWAEGVPPNCAVTVVDVKDGKPQIVKENLVFYKEAVRAWTVEEETEKGEDEKQMKKIGFIGVGIMGKCMVRNLMKAGFELHIYARTKAKVEDVIAEGAVFHESIETCVKGCDAVITIVGFPQDVEEVYFDAGNILDSAQKGTYLIDMTTTSPQLAEKIYKAGKERGFHVLDAPVTGGDTGAKAGTLSILAGGDREDFKACMPVFEAMGTNINYQGAAGAGQHCKLANQILIAGALSGVCEALAYVRAKGLDPEVVLKSLASGAAGSAQLTSLGPKIVKEDYAPGFFMKHFVKDMKLALIESNMSGLDLGVLSQTLANCEELEAEGYGELGTQILAKYYEGTEEV